jgi:endonuclease/exonuclease/phosphatase family metal-dependent hydrolase
MKFLLKCALFGLLGMFGFLGTLLSVNVSGADAPSAPPKRDPATLRVMTYNIHVGRGTDGKLDLERIAKIIRDADVDVVAIQEVDRGAKRTGKLDESAELARLTRMHAEFGKAIDHDGGDYGQVILSRRPIQKLDVHKLPNEPGQEQRIALVAQIPQARPLPDLLFVGTHLHAKGGGDALRLSQAKEIARLLKDDPRTSSHAALLLGDLNATPKSDAMTFLGETWTDASADSGPTIPAEKPAHKIDYVLVPKGSPWKVVSAKVLDEPVASDHRPVVVELQWKQ